MLKVVKYILTDILRNKVVIGYALLLLLVSLSVFSLEDNSQKGMLSLLNITLFIVPLVCIVFSTIYLYNSAEFIELLVSQPVRRSSIWLGIWFGLAIALSLAFVAGAGLPLLLLRHDASAVLLFFIGIILSLVFVSVAMVSAVISRDKARGIGMSVLLWLYFALVFDGIVLFFLFQFADYPLEKAMMVLSSFNPIDLARILVLLQMDVSALMGYTGAIFKDFFGTALGIGVSFVVLVAWVVLPLWYSVKRFEHKDL